MRRGERIGDAYVRVHADGSRLGDQLSADLDKAAEDGGKRWRKAWEEGFSGAEFDSDEFQKSLDKMAGKIQGRLDRLDFSGDNLRRKMEGMFSGDLGVRMADNLLADIEEGLREFDGNSLFGDLDRQARRAAKELTDEFDAATRKQREDRDKDFELQHKRLRDENKAEEEAAKERTRLLHEALRKQREDRDKEWDLWAKQLKARNDAEDEAAKERARLLHEALLKQRLDRDREFELHIKRLHDEVEAEQKAADDRIRINKQVSDFKNRMWQQQQREIRLSYKANADAYKFLREELDKLKKGTQGANFSLAEHRNLLGQVRSEAERLGIATPYITKEFRKMSHELRMATPRLDRHTRSLGRFGDRVGRIFGRGSRNNFLNLVGVGVGGMVKLMGTLTVGVVKGAFKIVKAFGEIAENAWDMSKEVMAALREGSIKAAFSTFFNSIIFGETTMATAGLNIVAGLAALGAVAAAVALSAGVLTAALSALAGVVVALAGSISFALTGALAPLVGVLAPLAAGIGVVAGAFLTLDEAQKKALKADVKPLANAFKDLGKAAGEVLFKDVGKWAKQLKPVIEKLKPGVVGVARAIRNNLGSAIQEASKSKGMQKFIDAFNKFLPQAVGRLTNILTNTMAGIGGVFRALIPITREFLGWLDKITTNFSQWANSAKGQKEMKSFFADAAESAKALGDFLGKAATFLGDLLAIGKDTGDSLFRKMADQIEKMVKWLSSREGKKSMEEWMAFAYNFAIGLGKAIKAGAQLWDALDNPLTRTVVLAFIDQLIIGFNFVTGAVKGTMLMISGIGKVISLIGDVANHIIQPWIEFKELIESIKPPDWSNFGPEMLTAPFKFAGDLIGGTAGKIGGIVGGLFGKGGDIPTAAEDSGKSVMDLFRDFVSLKDQMKTGGAASEKFKEAVAGLSGAFDTLSGSINQATRAAALQELEKMLPGISSKLQSLGFGIRDIAKAAAGDPGAITGIFDAFAKNPEMAAKAKELGISLESLRVAFGTTGAAVKESQKAFRDQILVGQDLKFLYKSFPRNIATKIDAKGIVPTTRGIAKLTRQYKLTPKQVRTIIRETGAETTAKKVRKVAANLREVKGSRADIKTWINDIDTKTKDGQKQAKSGAKAVKDALNKIEADPKLGPYVAEIRAKMRQARADGKSGANAVGQALQDGLLNGLDGAGSALSAKMYSIVSDAIAAGRAAARSESPSKETRDLTRDMGRGMVIGLEESERSVVTASRLLTEASLNEFGGRPGNGATPTVSRRSVTVPEIKVYTNSDPEAVAQEVVNRVVGLGY